MANAKCMNGFIYSWQGAKAMKASSTKLMAKGYKGGFAYAYGQVRVVVASEEGS